MAYFKNKTPAFYKGAGVLLLIQLIIISFLLHPPSAVSKEIDLRPLSLLLSENPHLLGTGELDTHYPDIYYPVKSLEQRGNIYLQYTGENVLNMKEEGWKGTSIGYINREASGIIPFELSYLKKSAISFLIKGFESKADVPENGRDISFYSIQDYDAKVITFSTSPVSFIRGGIGWEGYSDHSNNFFEVSLISAEGVSLNYRNFKRQMKIDTSLIKESHLARFSFNPTEDVNEIALSAITPQILNLRMAVEEKKPENIEFSLKISPISTLSIGYYKLGREMEFYNNIIIDDKYSGETHGVINYSMNGLEMDFHPSKRRYVFGIKESIFDVNGAGNVSGEYILNFWENLLSGKRFFNYNSKARFTQYYAGIEDKTTERLNMRGGIQYIITLPEGDFDHWTPFPLLNIGKLDREIITLPYTKATFGGLTFGISYKINNIELCYAIGQIIPIKIEEKRKPPAEIKIEEMDIGKLKEENTGGNIQSLRMTWYF